MNAIIDQQLQGIPVPRYKVGDRVASHAIGSRAAFEGVIESVYCYRTVLTYNVRADDGGLWNRSEADLRAVVVVLTRC